MSALSDLPAVAADRRDLARQHQLRRQRSRAALSKHARGKRARGQPSSSWATSGAAKTGLHSDLSRYVCMALQHHETSGSGPSTAPSTCSFFLGEAVRSASKTEVLSPRWTYKSAGYFTFPL